MQYARHYKLICEETANCLDRRETWTKGWVALNAYGVRREPDDQDVVRRPSTGWLKVFANMVILDESEVMWAIIMINDRFQKLHGMVIEDMSDRKGRVAVAEGLRATAKVFLP